MTKTFNIMQKVRKRWEMEETALIWRWLPAFPCGKACAAAPAEPRNDKSGNLPLPEGRRDKLACASHPCHCEEAEGRRGNLGKAVTNSPEAFLRFGCILRDCRALLRRGFPVLRPVLRDCRALLRKARNDKLGCLSHSEGRSAELASAALPCHSEERSDVGISSRHLRIRRGPAVPALTAVYRITKPGHTLRRVPVRLSKKASQSLRSQAQRK